MIINKKKYEKLNNDLVDIKVKAFNDVKKALDGENKIMGLCLQIKEQRDQYKAERDTLIDDIAVLKANISRLERENDDQEGLILQFIHDLQYAEWEIVPSLKKQNEQQEALLKDFSKFINYKLEVIPANATYKYYRSELDKLGVK